MCYCSWNAIKSWKIILSLIPLRTRKLSEKGKIYSLRTMLRWHAFGLLISSLYVFVFINYCFAVLHLSAGLFEELLNREQVKLLDNWINLVCCRLLSNLVAWIFQFNLAFNLLVVGLPYKVTSTNLLCIFVAVERALGGWRI